jgi:hypothetical protein
VAWENFHLFPGFGVDPVPVASSSRPISMKRSWACIERATVAVFGLLLACIFGVLLAWMVMAVGVGTDDKGKTSTSTEKIEILRVRPVPTDPARTGKKSPRRRWSGSGPLHSSGARAARLARA